MRSTEKIGFVIGTCFEARPNVFFNVFLLLLFFGGIVLDKFGIRFTGIMSTTLMFVGALIKWYAVSHTFEGMLFGYQTNHTMLTVRFFDPDMGIYYKGNTYISNLKMTGNVGSLVSISLSFQPTGPLTPATVTDFECGGIGKIVQDYSIDWSGSAPTIVDDENDSIDWYEIDVSTKIKTRIWTERKTMVIKDTAANVVALIEAKDSATLLSKAVIVNKSDAGTIVVGPGKYTVIINYQDHLGHPDGNYNSTF